MKALLPLAKGLVKRHRGDMPRWKTTWRSYSTVLGSFFSMTFCFHFGRYSAVSDLLTDLDSETKQALLSLYGVKESRKRREAGSMPSTLEGTPPRFFKLIPLLVFNENEKGKARDFFTGRKRKISGKIIHKASNVMHVHESKKLVGFQLVRLTSSQFMGMGEIVGSQSLLDHYSQ